MDATRAWASIHQQAKAVTLAADPLTAMMNNAQAMSATPDNPIEEEAGGSNFAAILQALATTRHTPASGGESPGGGMVSIGEAVDSAQKTGTDAALAASPVGPFSSKLAGLPTTSKYAESGTSVGVQRSSLLDSRLATLQASSQISEVGAAGTGAPITISAGQGRHYAQLWRHLSQGRQAAGTSQSATNTSHPPARGMAVTTTPAGSDHHANAPVTAVSPASNPPASPISPATLLPAAMPIPVLAVPLPQLPVSAVPLPQPGTVLPTQAGQTAAGATTQASISTTPTTLPIALPRVPVQMSRSYIQQPTSQAAAQVLPVSPTRTSQVIAGQLQATQRAVLTGKSSPGTGSRSAVGPAVQLSSRPANSATTNPAILAPSAATTGRDSLMSIATPAPVHGLPPMTGTTERDGLPTLQVASKGRDGLTSPDPVQAERTNLTSNARHYQRAAQQRASSSPAQSIQQRQPALFPQAGQQVPQEPLTQPVQQVSPEQPTQPVQQVPQAQPAQRAQSISTSEMSSAVTSARAGAPVSRPLTQLTMATWQRLSQRHQDRTSTARTGASADSRAMDRIASMPSVAQAVTNQPEAAVLTSNVSIGKTVQSRSISTGVPSSNSPSLPGRFNTLNNPRQSVAGQPPASSDTPVVLAQTQPALASRSTATAFALTATSERSVSQTHNANPIESSGQSAPAPGASASGVILTAHLAQSLAAYQHTEEPPVTASSGVGSDSGHQHIAVEGHTHSVSASASPGPDSAAISTAAPVTTPSTIPASMPVSSPNAVQTTTPAELLPTIVQQATLRLHTNGQSEFRLTVHPADLGAVTVSIRNTGTQISIHLAADHPEVVSLLRDNAGHLHQTMTEQSGMAAQITIGQANNGNGSFTNHNHGGAGFGGFAGSSGGSGARHNDGTGSSTSGFSSSGFGGGGQANDHQNAQPGWNTPAQAQQAGPRATPPSPRALDPTMQVGASRTSPTGAGHVDTWA